VPALRIPRAGGADSRVGILNRNDLENQARGTQVFCANQMEINSTQAGLAEKQFSQMP